MTRRSSIGKRLAGVALAMLGLVACGQNDSASEDAASSGDILETGLQGQIPIADQLNGKSATGYRKGLRLVGQNSILDRGANGMLAWLDDCAYVTTLSGAQLGGLSSPYTDASYNPLNGMAVIDATDPRNPKLLNIVQSPALLAPHEGFHANAARHILVATQTGWPTLEVYEARDCRNPVLRSTIQITESPLPLPLPSTGPVSATNGYTGHALCVSDDGRFAVATSTAQLNAIIDLSDLEHPKVLKTFMPTAHDCGFSPDGSRLYLALFGFVSLGTGLPDLPAPAQNGMMIMDFSQYTNGVANPALPMLGFLGWNNDPVTGEGQSPSAGSHTARWFRQNGHEYLFSSDEWPAPAPCSWGHGRILDIADERHPVKISDIRLEVQDPIHCAVTTPDLATYSAHYVGFDNRDNATTVFTTNFAAGLRVWDIRDPTQPKEIAYWHPAPNPNTPMVAGGLGGVNPGLDAVTNYVRYRPETGHIWTVGASAGFQILEFTDSAGPTAPRPNRR